MAAEDRADALVTLRKHRRHTWCSVGGDRKTDEGSWKSSGSQYTARPQRKGETNMLAISYPQLALHSLQKPKPNDGRFSSYRHWRENQFLFLSASF